jgi:hypothetical protein
LEGVHQVSDGVVRVLRLHQKVCVVAHETVVEEANTMLLTVAMKGFEVEGEIGAGLEEALAVVPAT